jgi:hypothetical protein
MIARKNEKMMRHRYAIAACARWENEFIIEWLTYYQIIGYDHVYLYCNDDNPSELYEKILPFSTGKNPFVTFHYWKEQGKHRDMMLHFVDCYLNEVEWISFFDIDEFLRLPAGTSIREFMADFEDRADSVLFNWVFFGPNGHKTHPGTPVLSTYVRREPGIHPLTKHVTRAEVFREGSFRTICLDNSFVHRITGFTNFPIRSMNVLGDDMTDYFEGFPDRAINFNGADDRQTRLFATAAVHHYAFRSEKAFWDRSARGLKGDYRGEKMWTDLAEGDGFAGFLENVNRIEDTRLADQWVAWVKKANELVVVADPIEAAARAAGLPWPLPPITADSFDWTNFEHPMKAFVS